MFKTPLVIAETGGRGGGGAKLTPLGSKVVDRFRAMEAGSWAAVEKDFRKLAAELRKGSAASS
jgi:molybdate transport system regulatory protein